MNDLLIRILYYLPKGNEKREYNTDYIYDYYGYIHLLFIQFEV